MRRALPVLAVAVSVVATAWWTLRGGRADGPAEPPDGAPEAPPQAAEPLRVLALAGTPFERGVTHGRALRDAIRRWLADTLPADEGLRAFAVETCGARLLESVPEAMREELRGIAEGAGIDLREALWLNTRFDLAAYGLQRGTPGSDAGEAAARKGPLVARHFTARDPGFQPGDLVVFVHDGEPPLVLVGLPGMIGGFLGVRGEAAAAPVPRHGPAQPVLSELAWPLLVRRLLEEPPAADAIGRLTAGREMAVAWCRPDGVAGSLALGPGGASWRADPEGLGRTIEGGDRTSRFPEDLAERLDRLDGHGLLVLPAPDRGLLVRIRFTLGGYLVEAVGKDIACRARVPRG